MIITRVSDKKNNKLHLRLTGVWYLY